MIQRTVKKNARPLGLTSAHLAALHAATGLSPTSCRRLLNEKRRPTNPLIASAWDEQVEQLGLKQGAK